MIEGFCSKIGGLAPTVSRAMAEIHRQVARHLDGELTDLTYYDNQSSREALPK